MWKKWAACRPREHPALGVGLAGVGPRGPVEPVSWTSLQRRWFGRAAFCLRWAESVGQGANVGVPLAGRSVRCLRRLPGEWRALVADRLQAGGGAMSNVWPGAAGVRESTSNERRPRGAGGLADWPGSVSPRVDAGKPGSPTVGRRQGNGATTTPRVPSETVRWAAATVTVWRPTRASLVDGPARPAEGAGRRRGGLQCAQLAVSQLRATVSNRQVLVKRSSGSLPA